MDERPIERAYDGTKPPPHVFCKSCERMVYAEPPGKCPQCKRYLPGNEAQLEHGLRRFRAKGKLPEHLRQAADEFRDSLLEDQGASWSVDEETGALQVEGVTAARAAVIRVAVDMEAAKSLLMRHVIDRGIDTPAGRKALDQLLAVIDRQHRSLLALGLGRRGQRVDPLDVIHRAVEEANADAG